MRTACIDLSTLRFIPWEPGTAFFLMDMRTRDGDPLPISPRQALARRSPSRGIARRHGEARGRVRVLAVPRNASDTARETLPGSRNAKSGMFGYSVLRASQNAPMVLDMIDHMEGFGIPLEGFHTETGPGVYEAAITVDDGVAAADKAVLFKTAAKEITARHGIMPTFMAKWNSNLPGSSGHVHQSLISHADHKNVFHADGGMSELMRHYIGGLCRYVPELMPMVASTVNSYKRTVPGRGLR